MSANNQVRAIRIIDEAIRKLSLNLEGLTVLTEVGSNNYVFTPIIAALAKAKKVFAWTADSSYGKSEAIKEECLAIAKSLGIESKIEISLNEKIPSHIQEADIITNSGFLRPLNASFLSQAKLSAVIPLMFEAWEVRAEDLDIDYCRKKGIKVAGTWENHPAIKVFDATGALALKLCFEAGYEIYQNNIAVWSNDHFGDVAVNAFISANAKSVKVYNRTEDLLSDFEKIDLLYVCDYHEERPILGKDGILGLKVLKSINRGFGVVHLLGDVDPSVLTSEDIPVYPFKKGRPHTMTFTLAHVGLTPIVNLLAAGFKVGEEMHTMRISSLTQPITF